MVKGPYATCIEHQSDFNHQLNDTNEQLWDSGPDDVRELDFIEILHHFAQWYDKSSPVEDLKNWEDLRQLEWYGDSLEQKLRFIRHLDDIANDIGEAEYNRRFQEVHELFLKQMKQSTQIVKEAEDYRTSLIDSSNANMGQLLKIFQDYIRVDRMERVESERERRSKLPGEHDAGFLAAAASI